MLFNCTCHLFCFWNCNGWFWTFLSVQRTECTSWWEPVPSQLQPKHVPGKTCQTVYCSPRKYIIKDRSNCRFISAVSSVSSDLLVVWFTSFTPTGMQKILEYFLKMGSCDLCKPVIKIMGYALHFTISLGLFSMSIADSWSSVNSSLHPSRSIATIFQQEKSYVHDAQFDFFS
jgi:hypothetical protein